MFSWKAIKTPLVGGENAHDVVGWLSRGAGLEGGGQVGNDVEDVGAVGGRAEAIMGMRVGI
jgi:hypothetical protein